MIFHFFVYGIIGKVADLAPQLKNQSELCKGDFNERFSILRDFMMLVQYYPKCIMAYFSVIFILSLPALTRAARFNSTVEEWDKRRPGLLHSIACVLNLCGHPLRIPTKEPNDNIDDIGPMDSIA